MTSQIDIANWALDYCGATRINSLSDTSERAELINNAWISTRDYALRARTWRFSILRDELTRDTATPAWGFDYQYTLPGDCLRVLQIGETYALSDLSDYVTTDNSLWRIEQDKILISDEGPLKLRYVSNAVAIGLWDTAFAHYFAALLAERIITRLTESETARARIKDEKMMALREAMRCNAFENPPVRPADGSWIASRY